MDSPQLTQVSYIKDLCTRYGFSFSKSLGQNFIINPGVCPKIVQASGLNKQWGALEIGPGFGVLTRELCAAAGKVAAVEVDGRLPPLLKETLEGYDNVEIILADALKTDLSALVKTQFQGMPVAVCANLPYYITTPLIMHLLESRLEVQSIVLMVQKEVATRLTAPQGSRLSGAITLAVNYYAVAEKVFDVQPGSFYPAPKVVSSVVRLSPYATPPVHPQSEKAMFATIKAAFGQRRKTAANAISAGLGLPKAQVLAAMEGLGLQASLRAEQLHLQTYADLSDVLHPGT
ncbi:16S rRNA (adenine(1518)-N(6)/adenine(1519)-N(6))-dimethyltransferase RsmA [Ruminococcaceae bacterium OttesenSCG-928-N02]|nr:16S rRNA (adenine(1518)-N(6)/adenine(1519)-N(6))-dimethyltransferase RsmA [Ruminococcaceae bacterium OttesenSCG-928-N02]